MTAPPVQPRMAAVLLTGHGGLDRLVWRTDVATPQAGPGEVLIQVAAAGINNTDINTRTGWYSRSVTGATAAAAGDGNAGARAADGSWTGRPLRFPRIQGADCCGRIVATGPGVDPARIGERVLVRPIQDSGEHPFGCITWGSECDGGFAQFARAAAAETYAIDCGWSDAELAAIPCAWSTAENMLHRAGLGAERVLITGASGGVGSAAIQLARRRGAAVTAVCGAAKAADAKALGAERVLDRDADPVAALGPGSLDLVVDVVGGRHWPRLLDLLRPGGRYAGAGAIAGPLVELDLRTLYLKDLTLFGCTFQDRAAFEALIAYIERGEIRPPPIRTYPLAEFAQAQRDFLTKTHSGKLILLPPPVGVGGVRQSWSSAAGRGTVHRRTKSLPRKELSGFKGM